MPYDIYGQPLRTGYCEVHPDTRGTYPCEQCEDDYWAEREYDRARERAYYADQQAEYDAHLEAEYAAHCRAECYRARAVAWLDHNRYRQALPTWWYEL